MTTDDARPALTRSQAEERFLELIRAADLPTPDVNTPLHGFEVDFLWREQRLVVEIDGYAYHSDRQAFEGDRSRDATLAAHGYRVIRVTWRQLRDAPTAVVARVAQALARAD
jgi:very-short-patch-repair endonuclease